VLTRIRSCWSVVGGYHPRATIITTNTRSARPSISTCLYRNCSSRHAGVGTTVQNIAAPKQSFVKVLSSVSRSGVTRRAQDHCVTAAGFGGHTTMVEWSPDNVLRHDASCHALWYGWSLIVIPAVYEFSVLQHVNSSIWKCWFSVTDIQQTHVQIRKDLLGRKTAVFNCTTAASVSLPAGPESRFLASTSVCNKEKRWVCGRRDKAQQTS